MKSSLHLWWLVPGSLLALYLLQRQCSYNTCCINTLSHHAVSCCFLILSAMDRNTGKARGFGHVDFDTPEAAASAAETLNGSNLDGRDIKVEVAQARGERTPAAGGDDSGTTVFIRGFDTSMAEDDVRAALQEVFGECGEIKSIRLPSDREAGVLKGMGYVEFATVDAKNKAAELNGTEVAGGELYVDGNVKPRTPREDFGSGGRGGRGGFRGGRGGRDGGRGGRGFGGRDGGRGGFRGGRGGRDGGRGGRGGMRIDTSAGGSGKKMSFDD